jgi:hypothetical protein
MKNRYRILVPKPEGERPLRRPKGRWEDTIKINLREVELEGMDWTDATG